MCRPTVPRIVMVFSCLCHVLILAVQLMYPVISNWDDQNWTYRSIRLELVGIALKINDLDILKLGLGLISADFFFVCQCARLILLSNSVYLMSGLSSSDMNAS